MLPCWMYCMDAVSIAVAVAVWGTGSAVKGWLVVQTGQVEQQLCI
jgi:hypothetical protein